MMRVTLDRVLRHKTLHHFFAKSPHGTEREPARSLSHVRASIPHRYAHAYQLVQNSGGSSMLGLWDPQGDFSLSQQWYSAHTQAGTVQTAECGNLHYPAYFGPTA